MRPKPSQPLHPGFPACIGNFLHVRQVHSMRNTTFDPTKAPTRAPTRVPAKAPTRAAMMLPTREGAHEHSQLPCKVLTGERWTGSLQTKASTKQAKIVQKMSENGVFSSSGQFFGHFSDIFSTFGHFVDIPFFRAVQRFARYSCEGSTRRSHEMSTKVSTEVPLAQHEHSHNSRKELESSDINQKIPA